ncbi:MAG: hypothetical protein KAW92_10160 [Candidatus Cloacimonetes bacterium]|nr:hypothetical protein [Candidatus Cloacimonadota bacterium]
MKRFFKLSIVMFIALLIFACGKDSTTAVDNDYTKYIVTIINDSSYEITNICLGMIGTDNNVSIYYLAVGESTSEFEFLLPKPNSEIPICYGDYFGHYIQESIEKFIFIICPEPAITIHIDNESYFVEKKHVV